MKRYRKIIGGLFLLSSASSFIGYILGNSDNFGICDKGKWSCIDNFEAIGIPIFTLSLSLTIIFFILLFLRKGIFHTWGIYFASWFLPLSAFLMYLAQGNCGGGFGIGDCLVDEEFTSMFMAGTFLVISLFIIAIKSYKLRQKEGLFSFLRR